MLDGRVLGASQVEYKPFGKPPLKKKVERLLDKAGQRAQEVERGAEAVEETAAVAARWPLLPRALGTWGAWLKEQQPWRHRVAGTLAGAAGVGAVATAGLAVGLAGGAASASRAARAGCWRTRFRPQQGSARTRPCRTSGPPTT